MLIGGVLAYMTILGEGDGQFDMFTVTMGTGATLMLIVRQATTHYCQVTTRAAYLAAAAI
jgi:hypothetical protein